MQEKLFRTSDLNFAAFLMSLDVRMVNTEKDRVTPTKIVFVFDTTEAVIHGCKTQFYGGTGSVNVQKFTAAQRQLKALCHSD